MSARLTLYLHLGLALLTVATFLPVLGAGFVAFDDPLYVTGNPRVQAGISGEGVAWALTAEVASNWHPLTVLSHMLDCELFGLNPKGHHLTSLLLHAANVLLLFEVLRRTTGAVGKSALVAALFAVHPTHVESVAWIAERKDVLSGLFFLLTLAAYAGYARRPSTGRYLLVAATLALGLAAKPMLVTLPCVLLLLDVWPLGRWRSGDGGRAALNLLGEKIPLFVLAAAASAVTLLFQRGAQAEEGVASFGLRLANALTALAAYLGDSLLPRGLAVFYPFPPEIPVWQAAGAALLLAALTAGALALGFTAGRAPGELRDSLLAVPVGWLWFLGMLVPVLGLVQVGAQARADRYLYLPSIGLFVALVWGAGWIVERWGTPGRLRLAGAAGLILVLACGISARAQTAYWVDTVALFRRAVAVTEGNYLAHLNLAEALRERGEPAEALVHYRAAVAARPQLPVAHAALGSALRAWGRPAEALPHLERAVTLAPRDPRLRLALAAALDDLGRPDAAIGHLETALALDPESPAAPAARRGLEALRRRAGPR
ncbi:MAG TPA: tetratricopeptide repeat protein [Mycobacteriales bacterium]|nr:tetratricopeptide repeat protein [Mycobacteriales bacterium]